MKVEIRPVRSERELRQFVQLPYDLYAACEQWVPPLVRDQIRALRPQSNPAFDHCRVRLWTATHSGRVVGRIAGVINNRYIERWGDRRARFGWLEFVDDPQVSGPLLRSVEEWAAAEKMDGVHGPLGFTNFDPAGLLVEGFDEPGTMMEIYNHPYYSQHIEALGYRKDTDWVEYELKVPREVPEKVTRVGELVLKRGALRMVETSTRKDILRYSEQVFDLLNEAYSGLYGSVELTPSQVEHYSREFCNLIDPRYNKLVVDEKDRLVAVGLNFPSLADALRRANGRLFPMGFVYMKQATRNPRRLNLGLVAVRSAYQGRGVPAVMMADIARSAHENGVRMADTGRQLEDNHKARSLWNCFDARQCRRRRVYRKALSG